MASFVEKLLLMSSIFVGLLLFSPYGVQGTLTPSGTVSVDCGSQQTFTCDVTGITTNSAAGWIIMGLVNITASGSNGVVTANNNPRITGTGGNAPISTIAVADFTMSDNGGNVQCINTDDGSEQGTATISVELPSCPTSFSAIRDVDFTSATITYQLATPPPVTSTTVTYCPTSSPNCRNSMDCPSTGPCTISGLDPCVEYNLSAIPTNNCGSATGCTGNSMVVDSQDVPPQLTNVDVQEIKDTSVQVTWNEPSSTVTSVTVTYCPESTPDCRVNVSCTTSPCTIDGLMPNTTYGFSVTPNNNCGAGNAISKSVTTNSTGSGTTEAPTPGLPIVAIVVPIVAAIILVVLIVVIVIVAVIWCMKKKHGVKECPCIQKKEKENGRDGDVIYEDPGKNNDIKMQSSPAYQTVSSVCSTKDDYYYPGMTDGVKMEPSPAYQTVS